MAFEIKVPSVGESVTEALLAQWYKEDGDHVQKDEPLYVIETDKVTLEVTAEAEGVLHIGIAAGETVAIGAIVGTIDTAAAGATAQKPQDDQKSEPIEPQEQKQPAESQPGVAPGPDNSREKSPEPATISPPTDGKSAHLSPSVERLLAASGLNAADISGSGPDGRITRSDVLLSIEAAGGDGAPAQMAPDSAQSQAEVPDASSPETITREPMSPLRRRIADHLLKAKQNTAMLTTFNDIDMTRVQALRAQFKDSFKEKYGISLGMMSFFIKACVEALKEFPQVNAYIDAKDIIYHHYYHIGVAIGSEKGLVVPVIRHADTLNFAQLEQAIVDFVNKIKENRLELSDLEGGTFTISNGGVFGSLLSTPILNMPQSGILGMHRIEKRPVAIEDQMVIRPMMYLALSYDHRIIDGREAVTFLKRIKECVENPERIMMEI
jgi:2-oxoglutarate dehydrogenase E2 component (dihydrolipoamide succinyltransferase)